MRHVLIIALTMLSASAFCQSTTTELALYDFNQAFQNTLSKYNCMVADGKPARIISAGAFDTTFKTIFGKVIFGNNDVVKQGSAGSFTVGQFESKLGISFSFANNKKKPLGVYHSFGVAATSSTQNFQLYAKGQWQRGIGLTYTITQPIGNKGIYFDKNDCLKLSTKRNTARVYWLKQIKELVDADIVAIDANIRRVDTTQVGGVLSGSVLNRNLSTIPIADAATFENQQKIITGRQALEEAWMSPATVQAYADSIITDFDKKNFAVSSYHLFWMNYSVKPEYKGINTYDTSLAILAQIRRQDFFRFTLDVSGNYFRNASTLFFGQLGLAVKNTNYLEGKKPADIQKLLQPVTPTDVIVEKDEAVVVDQYENFRKDFLLLNPYIGGDWFLDKNRVFGLELFGNYKLGFEQKDVPFTDLFSMRAGVLLSMNGKTDMGKTTFGILAQWDDAPVKGVKVNDYFSLNLRVGIPFNN